MGKLSWDLGVSNFWWQWVTLSMNSENGQTKNNYISIFFLQSFAKILYIVLTEVRGWFCIADVDAETASTVCNFFNNCLHNFCILCWQIHSWVYITDVYGQRHRTTLWQFLSNHLLKLCILCTEVHSWFRIIVCRLLTLSHICTIVYE